MPYGASIVALRFADCKSWIPEAEAGLQEAAGTKLDEAGAKAGEIKQATAVKVEELAKQAQK